MDSLGEKNDRTRCLFFSSGGTRLVFPASCVCVFIPSPVRVGTLLLEVHWGFIFSNLNWNLLGRIVQSFFSAKESIFRVKNLKFSFMGAFPFSKTRINPANKSLFAGLLRQITSPLDFLPWKWILWQKKMTARDVYFSAQGLKDLFPDPLIWRERQIKVGLARVDDIS